MNGRRNRWRWRSNTAQQGHTVCMLLFILFFGRQKSAYVIVISAFTMRRKFIIKIIRRRAWIFSQTDGCALLSNAYIIPPPPPFFLRVLFCSENHLFDSKRCLPPDYWIMAKNKAAFSIQFPILEVGGWGLYIKIGNWCFCLKKEEKTPRIAKRAIQRETVVPLSFISFCNLPFCHAAYCKSRSWPLDPSCQDCPRTVYGWTGQDSRIIAIVL